MFEADAMRQIVDIVRSGIISGCYLVLLAPLLPLLHSLDDILQVGVEDEAENLSLSCFRDIVLPRCDTTIKFIVKNSQISIILKYGVAGRL